MSIDYTATARTIAVTLSTTDAIDTFDMTRDDNGNMVIATLTTHAGHLIALSTERDEDGEFVTYSVYAPGDTDLEADIATDGFEVTSEEQATEAMAAIAAHY